MPRRLMRFCRIGPAVVLFLLGLVAALVLLDLETDPDPAVAKREEAIAVAVEASARRVAVAEPASPVGAAPDREHEGAGVSEVAPDEARPPRFTFRLLLPRVEGAARWRLFAGGSSGRLLVGSKSWSTIDERELTAHSTPTSVELTVDLPASVTTEVPEDERWIQATVSLEPLDASGELVPGVCVLVATKAPLPDAGSGDTVIERRVENRCKLVVGPAVPLARDAASKFSWIHGPRESATFHRSLTLHVTGTHQLVDRALTVWQLGDAFSMQTMATVWSSSGDLASILLTEPEMAPGEGALVPLINGDDYVFGAGVDDYFPRIVIEGESDPGGLRPGRIESDAGLGRWNRAKSDWTWTAHSRALLLPRRGGPVRFYLWDGVLGLATADARLDPRETAVLAFDPGSSWRMEVEIVDRSNPAAPLPFAASMAGERPVFMSRDLATDDRGRAELLIPRPVSQPILPVRIDTFLLARVVREAAKETPAGASARAVTAWTTNEELRVEIDEDVRRVRVRLELDLSVIVFGREASTLGAVLDDLQIREAYAAALEAGLRKER